MGGVASPSIAVSKGASPLGAPGFVYAVTDSNNLQCHRVRNSSSIQPSVPKNSERDRPFCSKADVCGKARGRTIVSNGNKITEKWMRENCQWLDMFCL